LKGESKEEVLHSIDELVTSFTLLKIKVNSLPEDSDLLPYIAFTLSLGKTAASRLHKKFMVDQMTRVEYQEKSKIKPENMIGKIRQSSKSRSLNEKDNCSAYIFLLAHLPWLLPSIRA
jgi:hypothetical protein